MEYNEKEEGRRHLNPKKKPIWDLSRLIESWDLERLQKIAFVGMSRREDALKQSSIFPLPSLPEEFLDPLPKPGPVYRMRIPVSLVLKDSSTIPRALLIEADDILENPHPPGPFREARARPKYSR